MRKFYKKKLILISLLFVLIFGVIAYFKVVEHPNNSAYANTDFGFSFAYPATYIVKETPLTEGVSVNLDRPDNYIHVRASVASSDFLEFRVDRGHEIRFGNNVWKYDPPNEFCDGPGPCAQLRGQYGMKHAEIYYMVDAFNEDKAEKDLKFILTNFSLLK